MTSFTHLTKIITTNLDTTFVTCVCTLRSPRATVSYTKCHDNYTLFRFIPRLFLTYVKYFQLFYRVLFGQETGFGNWAMMVTSHAQLVNSDKQNELLFAALSGLESCQKQEVMFEHIFPCQQKQHNLNFDIVAIFIQILA